MGRLADREVLIRSVVSMWSAGVIAMAVAAMGLIVGGLWTWQGALELAVDLDTPKPELAAWAVRSAGVALIALAQVLILQFICGRFFDRRRIDRVLKWGCGVLCTFAALLAVSLGMAAGH